MSAVSRGSPWGSIANGVVDHGAPGSAMLRGQSQEAPAFSPDSLFSASEAGAWYDVSDSSTLFQDTAGTIPVTTAGQSVALILDKSGNGGNLSQATAASQPTYQIDAGGHPYLLFDGVDDYLTGAVALAQPYDRVSALQQPSWEGGILLGQNSGTLRQSGTSPTIQLGTVSSALVNGDLAVGVSGVVTEHWEGASSSLQVNNGTVDTGGSLTTTAMTSFALGAGPGGGSPGPVQVYGTLMHPTLSSADKASLKTWMGAKIGLSL